ncbi:biopolymer transporter ExbB [Tropicimonas sp. IMCC6043]|uniref:biopolymer transporter ExbB n=1 Tax=Tropicimonas sp. IMCC6043 TaxID=2510645 RepID=UPI001F5DE58D|nr:biopolymer transporter ExbB [Tropicimonas sp. IMCC6043]
MSDRPAPTQFSQPVRQITQMFIVCALFAAGSWVIFPSVKPVFWSNLWLNGTIALVFVIGILACFAQVAQLSASVRWIEAFARDHESAASSPTPRLLAPLAALLRSRGVNRQISSTSATSILDSVATRIEEGRDITRYLVNLLIFLGLLGTFYGLATTVPAVVETIRSLAPKEGETGVQVFEKLMGGLEAQLGGMGTAFGSSLLGLAGSLVVGLLELFASRGQNRFYRELEEWLSSITRLGFAGGDTEMSGEAGALVAVLDHMAEQMEAMRGSQHASDASRSMVDDKLTEVAVAVTALTRTLQHGDRVTDVLERIAEGQERLGEGQDRIEGWQKRFSEGQDRLAAAQARVADGQDRLAEVEGRIAEGQERVVEGQERMLEGQARMHETQQQILRRSFEASRAEGEMSETGGDAESRMRLRSIDVQLLRILEEMAAGRQEAVADLRADLATLIRELRRSRRHAGQDESGLAIGPDGRPES